MNDIKNQTGYFLFSLDTELAWGYYDSYRPDRYSDDGKIERQAIERIINLLDDFNIAATWAFVGHLFYEKCEKCDPCPILEWRGKYKCFDLIYESNSPLWYGADIIDILLNRGPRHEIAFHGFTHRAFNETAMDKRDARFEIQEWIRHSTKKDVIPQTVIFPRNKIGYLGLFSEYGFICYRGEELTPKIYSMPVIGRFLRQFHRQLSSFLLSGTYELPELDQNGLVNLPSTQHFYGYDHRLQILLDLLNLNKFSKNQMIKGVRKAAYQRKIIHIRAHPCDFKTEKDFETLRCVFEAVSELVNKGTLKSIGMADLAREVYLSAKGSRA